jgi:D-arabinose 1-dehydrogenase-like Zn-dependent alcohol dehydrogenase
MIVKDKIKLDKMTKYDLDNVADAHTDMENRKTSGSIILKI